MIAWGIFLDDLFIQKVVNEDIAVRVRDKKVLAQNFNVLDFWAYV